MSSMMNTHVDYTRNVIETGAFGAHNLISAQGLERNVLMLRKLDKPLRRADGKLARYELEYRWLSADCEDSEDEAYCCVQGSECTYWQQKEIKAALQPSANLFDHFQLTS